MSNFVAQAQAHPYRAIKYSSERYILTLQDDSKLPSPKISYAILMAN
jgi:hypothetical protein